MWDFLKSNSTSEDVAVTLEAILDGADFVWGDFTDMVIIDPVLDALRLKVLSLESSHPPGPGDSYVDPDGQEILRGYLRELRQGTSSWLVSAGP